MHREPDATGPQADDAGSPRITFGPFIFDRCGGALWRGDEPIPLRPLATRALLLLVEHPGRLVPRQELRRVLWGNTAVEWETGVHQVISQVRRALRDDPRAPVFVETIPRRGYRFNAEVIPESASTPGPSGRFHAWTFVGGAVSAFGVVVALFALCCGLFT